MTDEEMEQEGWMVQTVHPNPMLFEMDNGDIVYPAQDPEGNGPGALFGRDSDGDGFYFVPDEDEE